MKEKNVERKHVTTGKITGELIGGFILYGFLFGILYTTIITILTETNKSVLVSYIVSLALQAVVVYLVWKLSIKSAFKKMTIHSNEVSKVMKNLIIFTVILCLLNVITNFYQLKSEIDDTINSELRYSFYLLDDDEKEETINEIKTQTYGYAALYYVALIAIYVGVLPLEKKYILKYATDTNDLEEKIA